MSKVDEALNVLNEGKGKVTLSSKDVNAIVAMAVAPLKQQLDDDTDEEYFINQTAGIIEAIFDKSGVEQSESAEDASLNQAEKIVAKAQRVVKKGLKQITTELKNELGGVVVSIPK